MSDFSFESLNVYQIALEFAKRVLSITREARIDRSWSNQISRAAMSISLNIAEGSGRQYPKDKKQFYVIARGSLFECVPLVDIGASMGAIADEQRSELRSDCLSMAKMLTKLIQSVEGG